MMSEASHASVLRGLRSVLQRLACYGARLALDELMARVNGVNRGFNGGY